MAAALASGHFAFPPFSVRVTRLETTGFDGLMQVRWDPHGLALSFAYDVKSRWTPADMQSLRERAHRWQETRPELLPLAVLPYLSEKLLASLQSAGLSGLDLCGNGLLLAPPQLFVLRTGGKNHYPVPRDTPSVYRSQNISTLVPRVFLAAGPKFPSVDAVLAACRARMMTPIADPPPLSLPTVSRAISQLERDLVVTRQGRVLTLSDPVRLLEELERSFTAPLTTSSHLGRTELTLDAQQSVLSRLHSEVRIAFTGRASAAHYTGLGGPERLQLYVSDLPRVREALGSRETVAFPNVELLQTTDETAYFDAREAPGAPRASPLQTYLELSRASARERDAAKPLRARLLHEIDAARTPT